MSRLLFVATFAVLLGCQQPVPADVTGVPRWSLAPMPEFSRRGAAIGADSIFFFRVLHGVFADRGNVVFTLGSGDYLIVYLDQQGEIAARLGPAGAGPGEFRTPQGLFANDGQVAVWDSRNRRVAFFGDGASAEEYTIEVPTTHRVIGILADQVLVSTTMPNPLGPLGQAFTENLISPGDAKSYHLWSLDGEELGVLTAGSELPPASFVFTTRRDGRELPIALSQPSCLPELHYSVRGEEILIADSREGVVYRLARDGTRAVLHENTRRGTVTPEIHEAARGLMERVDPILRGRVTEESKQAAFARLGRVGDPLPSAWSKMIADRSGSIWLRKASCFPRADAPNTWEVLDGNGTHIASASMPGNFNALAIDDDAVFGVELDSYGVESVAVYRVAKP